MVYGDTDSLFVHLQGRSVKDAFKIGDEMAKEITKLFPYPVEMKFEKVGFKNLILGVLSLHFSSEKALFGI